MINLLKFSIIHRALLGPNKVSTFFFVPFVANTIKKKKIYSHRTPDYVTSNKYIFSQTHARTCTHTHTERKIIRKFQYSAAQGEQWKKNSTHARQESFFSTSSSQTNDICNIITERTDEQREGEREL
uniref:(northern house mosquito) hypothetical protein n=1 Tax=Culex pipiens TaxID=7175 RepID=A0A8D8KDE3_CULPI